MLALLSSSDLSVPPIPYKCTATRRFVPSSLTESRLIAKFSHPELQASVLDVDCTGRFSFLAGSKELAVVDLESPYEKAFFDVIDTPDPSILQCHPSDGKQFALVRRNICDVYSWSLNEGRLALVTSLQGYIRPINALDWCPMQPNVLATASSEQFRSITVWDLRDPVKLVKNVELFSSTSLLRWDPFREYHFATGGDFTVQFWDLRSNTPERHLSMQSSRVLAMAWSPVRVGEFALSTKDGSLRIWHLNDSDNALLVGNYKKVPMFHLRYTPKGDGIVSLPQRTRWTSSGLLLWRSDTLSPLRLVPAMDGSDEGVEYQSESGISEESCVLGFGWCLPELPIAKTFNETTFDLEQKGNLRELARPPNLVSWSRDHQLSVYTLPSAFLHSDGMKSSSHHTPPRPVFSQLSEKDSETVNASKRQLDSGRVPLSHPSPDKAVPQPAENDSPAFQFVTQEVSLLSSSIGQYRIGSVNRNGMNCAVQLTLYYCRRNHYHHHTVCGFDAGVEQTELRNRSDSLPLTDLDALFQSTTTASSADAVISNAQPIPSAPGRSLESLPSAGNVTLLAHFPPAYPAPNCPPIFAFIASDPVIDERTLTHILKNIEHTAEKTVSASRGCLEPCLRKIFKHLNSTDITAYEKSDETNLASSDPYVSFTQENPDFKAPTTTTVTGVAPQPPSRDAFVPFPRTSGVRISPSGLMVTFGLHQPLLEIVQAASPIPLGPTRTPPSFYDYLQLTEGKEHLFCKAADRPLSRQQTRFLRTVDQATDSVYGQLKRAKSAEAICGTNSKETVQHLLSGSLMSFESPKSVSRTRHFSGKTSNESRKMSTTSGRKASVIFVPEHFTTLSQPQQNRRASCATRFTPLHASMIARRFSYDKTRPGGSPRAIVSDLSLLIPMSRYLANAYILDIADPNHMCSHNLEVARTTGRPDLIQFWSFVSSLTRAKLRQPPFPAIIPPYASQSIGRPFFNTWLRHFLSLGDVQSLTMMSFVMAAIDAQSSPPALLLTAPPHGVATTWRHSQRSPLWLDSQKSPVRCLFHQFTHHASNNTVSSQVSRRSKSTVVPPTLGLLEFPENFTIMLEKADKQAQTVTSAKQGSSKFTVEKVALNQSPPQALGTKSNKPPTVPSPSEVGLSVPVYARTRSNSCSINPSTSADSTSADASESPQHQPCHTATHATNATESTPPQTRYSSYERASIALLQQHFSDQALMNIYGFTAEESQQDTYESNVWLLSFKHVLQYTHFLNVYISLLSAWNLIMPRAKFSAQWHKVLTWLHARQCPDVYHSGLAEQFDPQSQILLCPSEWRSEHMPVVLTHLLSLPGIQTKVVNPVGLASFAYSGNAVATSADAGHLLRCAVCNVTARGVIVVCPVCNHGGHMEHMSAWCIRRRGDGGEITCPAPNCDCRCGYLRLASEDAVTAVRQGL